MFFGLGGIVFFFIAVGALLPLRFADRAPGFWILEALILPAGIATFTLPFAFLHFANSVDRPRYANIVEFHTVWARLAWQPELGPKPLHSVCPKLCDRWLCVFR